ncbi:hypothetical protein CRUP_013603, partial [Coryphaenoides rupestris]
RQQHCVPVRPAHPLPHVRPGQHQEARCAGSHGLRPHPHETQLWSHTPGPPRLLGGEWLRAAGSVQVRPGRGRGHEHHGVQGPLGRRGLGAPGPAPPVGSGGRAAPPEELLPLLPLQAG